MIKKYYTDHEALGRVLLSVNGNARSFIARWKDGMVHLTLPEGVTRQRLTEVLDGMAPKILARRPADIYFPGMTVVAPGLEIEICSQSHRPDNLVIHYGTPGEGRARLLLGDAIDIKSPSGSELLTRGLKAVAGHHAPSLLLPRARGIADSLGLKVAKWSIGRGDRRLGCCNTRGEISLSRICVFLSEELRDYIVCHELAHLTEMNHSVRFHALCDSYLGGRERELIRKLNAYRWPIMR